MQAFIYPSYQNTCNILKAHGVEVGKTIADYSVESVRVTTTTAAEAGTSGGVSQHFYKDEQEVEDWKEKLLPSDLAVQPLLHPADIQIDAEVRVENPQVNAVEEVWCYGIE